MIHQLLYKLTNSLPCRIINRSMGQRYLERYYIGTLFGFTFYLHRFVASDGDQWVHDHPWSTSIALVLAGGYTEERLTHFDSVNGWGKRLRTLRLGSINIIRANDFHRIAEAKPNTWTLFIHRQRIKAWGFLQFKRIWESETNSVVYHQPYSVTENINWHTTAPLGSIAYRAPV